MFGFHPIDIFFALLAVWFVVRGCMRGFAGECISLAGFVLAFFLSFKYSASLASVFSSSAGINGCVAQLLAAVCIWLAVVLLAAVLRRLMKSILSAVKLGFLDTLLGVCSGIFKSVAVLYCFIIAGFLLTPVCSPTWMTNSDLLRYAGRHWSSVRKFIVSNELCAHAEQLPDGTLEQILRPYRTGGKGPR